MCSELDRKKSINIAHVYHFELYDSLVEKKSKTSTMLYSILDSEFLINSEEISES